MSVLKSLLESGVELHHCGRYEEAVGLYQKALAIDSNNADAHNLLSNAYVNLGDKNLALYHANQAIALGVNPEFFNNRGLLFIGMAKFLEAESDLKKALRINAEMPEAYNNLCIVYRCMKEFKKSKEAGLKSLDLRPDFPQAKASMGALMLDLGDFVSAESYLEACLAAMPDLGVAAQNLAKVKYKLNKFDQAIRYHMMAKDLGSVDLEGAFACAHSLIELNRVSEATDFLTETLKDQRNRLHGLDAVLGQDIFFGVLYKCMQYLCSVKHQHAVVEEIYKTSIQNAPSVNHALWVNLGSLYFSLHRVADAIDANERAIKCNPNQLWAYNNLGVCYMGQGESTKAIDCFKKTLELNPFHASALGWLLKEQCHICDWTDFDELRLRVDRLRQTENPAPISAFTALAVYDDPEALLFWARVSANEIFNESIVTASTLIERRNDKATEASRKVRVGYYSFDFRNHPVAHLTARLFELHDRSNFEIYAYSYGPDDGSDVRKRIESSVNHFRDLQNMPSVEIGQTIANDEIDFLIDLTGNTQHNRSDVFALRPAKIQAHWLGFIGTMGSKFYDYIIADEFVIPHGDECYFDEHILRIPTGFHVTDDTRCVDHLAPTRTQYGLPDKGFVFGSFCQTFKIQPEMYDAWLRILERVPDSVLWLANGPAGALENLKSYAAEKGIDPAKIIIAERCGLDEYLSRFQLIDLFLDTFPYTSGTVASDALRSGCPLLTLSGKTMVSRMAGSILTHVGMPEMIADSYEGYIEKAVELARDGERLQRLKLLLKNNTSMGVLLNTKKFVKKLENSILDVLRLP